MEHEYRSVAYPGRHPVARPLEAVAPYLLTLMLRNVSSAGFSVPDPLRPGIFSAPGCVIASPSYPQNSTSVDQNYVFNWTRDAAITAMEIAAADLPLEDGVNETLVDYVQFAARCQLGTPTLGRACYTVDGQPRPWSDQSDGPALQTSAILLAYQQLSADAQRTAAEVIGRNTAYLLQAYREPTKNLWEELDGHSLFARAVQVRSFQDLIDNQAGLAVPPEVPAARDWLLAALEEHWNGELLISVLDPASPSGAQRPARAGYDPNIDVVLSALYGALSPSDPRVLATAAALLRQWADPRSPAYFPINGADAARGVGPLLGRYPQDTYDGDVSEPVLGGHPWPVCTAGFAELVYRVAGSILATGQVATDALTAAFFDQLEVDATQPVAVVAEGLLAAGDRMLSAVLFHSDHLELSEQYDGTTGFEKSVANLTWSYAGFLSAVRARRRTLDAQSAAPAAGRVSGVD